MVASGSIGSDDLVWSEGMPQWTPRQTGSRSVGGPRIVLGPARRGDAAAGRTERGGELPQGVCKAITNSRPWVIFIAVVAFVYAGLVIVLGILALIFGANHHQPAIVAGGLIYLILGIDAALGGLLLAQYGNRIASLRYSPHGAVLEKAMDELRTFWIYVAINLIIILVFVVLAIIGIIANVGLRALVVTPIPASDPSARPG